MFTPQIQLTPEQRFWSNDLIKIHAKALNAKAKYANPNMAMTMYHPNTPAKLVPKEMKEVFEQTEAEVDQHAIVKKCDEIEQKNLLIDNENLIFDCFSKDVFYTVTNSMLTVSRFSDMHDALTAAQKRIAKLDFENSNLKNKIQNDDHDKHSHADPILDLKALDSQNKDLNAKVNALHDLNERFQAEDEKVKQHYKELYDLIKITRAKTIDKTNSLLAEIDTLKAQIKENLKCVTMPDVKPKVLSPGVYAIYVEPIPPRHRNNREVHLDYLKHLKKSVATLREIIEEDRVEKPLDSSLASACLYTKHSSELLEYVIGTCPKDFNKRDKQLASTLVTRKKQLTFMTPCKTSINNTYSHVMQQNMNKTNELVIPSTGVKGATPASGSKPRSNTKKDRTLPAKSDMKKVEVHHRENKSSVK
ncbi:hypothetical protein Tco_1414599 [Tanacetum coccineum]